jgi:rubrerythrin
MPEFLNPFSGMTPDRKMNKRELTRALRLALAAEEEAVHLYEALADATDDPLAKKVLQDIADEERVHAGEFQRLLSILVEDEDSLLAKGAAEVDEMAEE